MDSLPARPTETTLSSCRRSLGPRAGASSRFWMPRPTLTIDHGDDLRPGTAVIILLLLAIIAIAGTIQLIQIINS